jgi:hypothetical protein
VASRHGPSRQRAEHQRWAARRPGRRRSGATCSTWPCSPGCRWKRTVLGLHIECTASALMLMGPARSSGCANITSSTRGSSRAVALTWARLPSRLRLSEQSRGHPPARRWDCVWSVMQFSLGPLSAVVTILVKVVVSQHLIAASVCSLLLPNAPATSSVYTSAVV